MSALIEEFTFEEVESIVENVTDKVTEDSANASDIVSNVTNELVESKSGRKIKPNRKLYENNHESKKLKSESHKKSKSKKSFSTAPEVPKHPVDKTPAVEVPAGTPALCGYCHKGHQEDPLESGKMFSINGVITHYFCMLFTYNSNQLGADNEGLFGFYGEEVKQQIESGQKKICKYCSKPGATARCNKKHCGVMMHFPCGQEVGATFQFYQKMLVYCKNHRVKQKVETFPIPPDTDCVICYESVDQVGGLDEFKNIRAPCCGRHFHRDCVQRFAMSSGTQHFKCPNCNNKDDIMRDFKKLGIYVPYKDAEWELPSQSSFYNFQDMYVQTKKCYVKDCICKEKEGRNYNDVDGEFEIVLCDMCGSSLSGVHIKCAKINEETLDYDCVDCGGDVALVERVFESRNSSLANSSFNLSLASSVDESFSSADCRGDSIPSVLDFVKQFEIKPSDNESSYSKTDDSLDSLLNTSNDSSINSLINSTVESVSSVYIEKTDDIIVTKSDAGPPRQYKKRGPKSKTKVNLSTPELISDVQSKHNFFKHTEEMTKILEDLKKKDQEKNDDDLKKKDQEQKAKEAFLKSLSDAQTTGKTESKHGKINDNSGYEFGQYLAMSLGKDDSVKKVSKAVPHVVTPSHNNVDMADEIQRKISELAKSVGIPSLTTVDIEPTWKNSQSIRIRTDLMAVDCLDSSNIMDEPDNSDTANEEDISAECMSVEISEKRQKFGSFVFTKETSKTGGSQKKPSSYIEAFYARLEKSTAVVQDFKSVESVVSKSSYISDPPAELVNKLNGVDNIDEEIFEDQDVIDNINDVSVENDADTSNLGLEIGDTFTCSDSFIDELLDSPVKSSATLSVVAKETPFEEEVSENDAPGSNLIDISQSALVPQKNKESIVVVPVDPETVPKVVQLEPDNGDSVNIKYKPGPRSRTKARTTPAEVERTSPTKIKESIAENIKIFEEQAKSLKSNSDVETKLYETPKAFVTAKVMEEDSLEESTVNVKYRPGPKSRKKYLVVKDDENKENKLPASSPKRSSDSSNGPEAKKLKSVESSTNVVEAKIVSLDSSTSSEESSLEIIDLDSSDVSSECKSVDNVKVDTSCKVIEEVMIHQKPETAAPVETLVQVPSIATNSKRASKRPFQCPVCQGFFRSEMVLQQHLAKIHFWNRLLALPKECTTSAGPTFQCSEFPCRYTHRSNNIVAGHLATEHKVVFRIALDIFPDFKLPILTNTAAADPSITIIASIPARLPLLQSQPASMTKSVQDQQPLLMHLSPDNPNKRSASTSRPDTGDQTKKSKLIPTTIRPIILPSQPHKAVARVKPRTAEVTPTVLQTVEAPLLKPSPGAGIFTHSQYPPPQPFTVQGAALPFQGQGYFYPGYSAPGQYVDPTFQYNKKHASYN